MATDPTGESPSDEQIPAIDLRMQLIELRAERMLASSYGMTANATYMADLDDESAQVTAAYTGAAVTAMATLRGELFGLQVG